MDDLEKQTRMFIEWVLDNTENERLMDKMSNLIYPYTSKYKTRYPDIDRNQEGNQPV